MKIVAFEEVSAYFEKMRNKKITLVGGCFDILHFGHVSFLREAKKTGDILAIALESDEFIQARKKRVPVHNQQQRAEVLSELSSVDVIIQLPLMQSNDDYAALVKAVHPHTIAITEGDPAQVYKEAHARSVNAQVIAVTSVVQTLSTSQILNYETIFRD